MDPPRTPLAYVQTLKGGRSGKEEEDLVVFLDSARRDPPMTPDEIAAVNEAALEWINGDLGVSFLSSFFLPIVSPPIYIYRERERTRILFFQ